MNCIHCNNVISQERLKILPTTKTCVKCSTEERVGCVDITYHKTGNTIQILPKEHAEKINKASKRLGFGILSGMKRGSEYKTKITVDLDKTKKYIIAKRTEDDYNQIGEYLMNILEFQGEEKAFNYLESKKLDRTLSPIQYRKLRDILIALTNKTTEKIDISTSSVPEIDEDILKAMKNRR